MTKQTKADEYYNGVHQWKHRDTLIDLMLAWHEAAPDECDGPFIRYPGAEHMKCVDEYDDDNPRGAFDRMTIELFLYAWLLHHGWAYSTTCTIVEDCHYHHVFVRHGKGETDDPKENFTCGHHEDRLVALLKAYVKAHWA